MAPSSRSAAPVAPTRAPVRSVGSGAALPLSFDVRTAFDFALSLAARGRRAGRAARPRTAPG